MVHVELHTKGKSFDIIASVKGLGLKCISSNRPFRMGNAWKKIGFIRSAK